MSMRHVNKDSPIKFPVFFPFSLPGELGSITTPLITWTKKDLHKGLIIIQYLEDRFHMTSRRPCLCTKIIMWEFNSFHIIHYSKQFAKLLNTWLKTIDWGRMLFNAVICYLTVDHSSLILHKQFKCFKT